MGVIEVLLISGGNWRNLQFQEGNCLFTLHVFNFTYYPWRNMDNLLKQPTRNSHITKFTN